MSIYGARCRDDLRTRLRRDRVATSSVVVPIAAEPPTPSAEPATFPAEGSILSILSAVPTPGMPLQRVYSDKERELLGVFASLAPDEKAALHARLTSDTPRDAMCLAFRSLATERRIRLLASLEPKEARHGR